MVEQPTTVMTVIVTLSGLALRMEHTFCKRSATARVCCTGMGMCHLCLAAQNSMLRYCANVSHASSVCPTLARHAAQISQQLSPASNSASSSSSSTHPSDPHSFDQLFFTSQ
jgi:hypothetical protein